MNNINYYKTESTDNIIKIGIIKDSDDICFVDTNNKLVDRKDVIKCLKKAIKFMKETKLRIKK
jgi:hypothetical protein